jgi:hypothetical protein
MDDAKKAIEAQIVGVIAQATALVRKVADDQSLDVTPVSASKVLWDANTRDLSKAAHLAGQLTALLDIAAVLGLELGVETKRANGLRDALYL